MTFLKRILLFGLAGAIIGTPLDALHVATGVLKYRTPSLGLQAWWVPILFAAAGIALCEGHHQLRRRLGSGIKLKGNYKTVLFSLLLVIAVYGSSGFLKSSPYIEVIVFLVVYTLGGKYLWKESVIILILLSVGAAIVGPLIESLITTTGAFHYISPDLWKVPVWLPFIYLNVVFVAANFDNLLGNS